MGMMKHLTSACVFLAMSFLLLSCSDVNTKEEKWESIFNGKNLDGWTIKFCHCDVGVNYNDTFEVKDGVMRVNYDKWKTFDGRFGHIFYKNKLSHYKLRLEYRFVGNQVKGAPGWAFRNNGVMLHGQAPETMKKDQSFPDSVEVQLLGGSGRGKRSTANICTPGTHVVINGKLVKRHCIDSSSDTFHGDQWVKLEVDVRGSESIRHYINGKLVFDYTKPQLDNGTLLEEGTISLQAESHPTEFRNIEILKLEK